jgi:hypothetical protein
MAILEPGGTLPDGVLFASVFAPVAEAVHGTAVSSTGGAHAHHGQMDLQRESMIVFHRIRE